MNAPIPPSIDLAAQRVRCSCAVENVLFHPAPWYPHQEQASVEPACVACGKSLLSQSIPMGAHLEIRALDAVPTAWAVAVSKELADEVASATNEAVPADTDLSPARWTESHEAPEAYVTYLQNRPAPAPFFSAAQKREAAIGTGLLVAYVLFCIVV